MWRFNRLFPFLCISAGILLTFVHGDTNPSEVSALNSLYSNLYYNQQLTSWTSSGGDPCGHKWRGVTCAGSSVTEIRLPGLGLTGSMEGYVLKMLVSLSVLNLSTNNFNIDLPYDFPPNLKQLDLSNNGFTGNLWPISQITLEYLDLSFNKLSGNLPEIFRKFSSLTTLYLQNNQLTGDINVLADLPLQNLNVANNQFSGWIPDGLKNVIQSSGNQWNNGPAPPPPPGTGKSPPPPRFGSSSDGDIGDSRKSGIGGGGIAGIIISLLVVVSIVAFFVIRRKSLLGSRKYEDQSHAPLASCIIDDAKSTLTFSETSVMPFQSSTPFTVKPPPLDGYGSYDKNDTSYMPTLKKANDVPVNAVAYSVADLQLATCSFSTDNLLGEGSVGRVYRAQFDNGKVVAVKKINSSVFTSRASGDFMDVVSNISRLHHQNVTELVGYCVEHGQYLLVYEFHDNGTLYDFLYLSDEYSKPLTWNTRVKIALGTARALEYLHEVCLPSIIHKNFKSANILLDTELNPHVSDCGLSNLITNVEDQALDQYLTSGYCAPEVAMPGKYSLKSDVFSFGVVMLELLTGRKPFDSTRARSEQYLVRWASPQLHDIDALDRMVDPALNGQYPAKSLSRFADVVALCVQTEPEFRPPMSDIVQTLVRLVQRANVSKRFGVIDDQEASGFGDDTTMHDIIL